MSRWTACSWATGLFSSCDGARCGRQGDGASRRAPWTDAAILAAQWMIVVSTFAHDPRRTFIGLGIALAGVPVYFLWR